jgi:hypothetical protein
MAITISLLFLVTVLILEHFGYSIGPIDAIAKITCN